MRNCAIVFPTAAALDPGALWCGPLTLRLWRQQGWWRTPRSEAADARCRTRWRSVAELLAVRRLSNPQRSLNTQGLIRLSPI